MSVLDQTPAGTTERPPAPTTGGHGSRLHERLPRAVDLAALAAAVRTHWPILVVLACFAASAFVVPTLAPVATTDDWAYARSAEILLRDHRLVIFPVVAATAVFQVVWGALFGFLFGPSLGVFRLSTVVMVALGGLACYGLCRQLGVDRGRSALGAAAYLFNPLLFVLAFTFMTDPHFLSLLVIATWLYARGLEPGEATGDRGVGVPTPLSPAVVAGSVVAGLAFLTRQQGILIPLGALTYLLLARRLRPDRRSLVLVLQVATVPVLAVAGYYAWLRFVNDVPAVQTSFLREAVSEGWDGTWWLLRRLTVVELVYLGFFALPIAAAAVPAVRRLVDGLSPRGRWLVLVWEALLVGGVAAFWAGARLMPYVPQWLGTGGPGAPDVLGSRPRLLDGGGREAITVVCAVAALLLAAIAGRALAAAAAPKRATAGLALAIGLWQVAGILPPSYHYIGWTAGSLDRYLLPLIPFAICLALWALREVRLALPVGWLVVAAFAIVAVVGTRDYLVYMDAVWGLATDATAAGVPLDQLDAGSGWDGYHLYDYSPANRLRSRTPKGGPWWVYFYAPATDSSYVVAGAPVRGYQVVWQRSYSSWLGRGPTQLYLLRRPWRPDPSLGASGSLGAGPPATGAEQPGTWRRFFGW